MQKVIEHPSGVRVTVELPDGVPEAVFDSMAVDVDLDAKTLDDARAAIEAFGGVMAFEPFDRYGAHGGTEKRVHLKGAGLIARPLEFSLSIPTGRDEPVDETPFISELTAAQKSAAAEAS